MNETIKRWLPHTIAAAIVLLQVVVWSAVHRSDDEIERAWRTGGTRERLGALHVLTNRGFVERSRFGGAFIPRLLDEPDDRLKEAAFTNEVCKIFSPPVLQTRYSEDLERFRGRELPHRWRSFVIHHRKVGGYPVGSGLRMTRRELAWFLDSLEARPLSRRAIIDEIYTRVENLPPR